MSKVDDRLLSAEAALERAVRTLRAAASPAEVALATKDVVLSLHALQDWQTAQLARVLVEVPEIAAEDGPAGIQFHCPALGRRVTYGQCVRNLSGRLQEPCSDLCEMGRRHCSELGVAVVSTITRVDAPRPPLSAVL